MSLLGLDIGTTGCKAIIFDLEGNILGRSYREYPLIHPQPGWSEIDPGILWDSVKAVMKEAILANRTDDLVKALSVSAQGEAVVPVAKDGEVLYNFSVSFDDRTIPQCQWWEKALGKERIFQITGMPLHPMHTINKIIWFRENMPDVYKNTWKFLCVEDFVLFKLGAKPVIDYSLAARTMAFDIESKTWSEEMLSLATVDQELLPDVKPSGELAGQISPEATAGLGLTKDVILVTGGHDQACGALGAGVIKEGSAVNATGTSDVITAAFRKPLLTGDMLNNNYCCYPHVKKDMYITVAFNLTGGLLLRWYRDTLCSPEKEQARVGNKDGYEIIIGNASQEPVDVFIYPHFVGSGTPTLNPSVKGTILGLALATTKNDLTRAVLDSLNYEMRFNLDALEKSGVKVTQLRAIGGGAKSEKWLQMKADVFGKKIVSLVNSEAACLGAAILSGVAAREYKSVDEGVRKAVKIKKEYNPDVGMQAKYQDRYRTYKEAYPSIIQLNHFITG